MQQSKNVALAFLLGTFLTGGVLGFSANRYMRRDEFCTTKGANPMVDYMARRLGLNPTQSATINSILDRRAVQYHKAMAPIQTLVDSIRLDAREQMRHVLTQEQKQEFEALIQEMNDSTHKGSGRE